MSSNVSEVLQWAMWAATNELWSIRKSSVQLVGSVAAGSALDPNDLSCVLQILSKGKSEKREE